MLKTPAFADYPAHSGSCPECGYDGPHTVQSDGFGSLEFMCEGCGYLQACPASYVRRARREKRERRALGGSS